MHTHINTGDKAKRSAEDMRKVGTPVNTAGNRGVTPDDMAALYQGLNMMAVIFDVDSETTTGVKISNAETAGWVKKYPDTFIGFGSVDPWKGPSAVEEVKRCADMGLRGMKFQQATQAFCPTNPRFFPIYETCSRLNLPVIFHGGTTAISAGTPGGRGLVLEYCKPIPYIDDIAARYPELRIIIAHPAWPWHDDQLAVMRHKGNVYMDLSGWAPKYFPESIVHNANTLVQDKVFFGSDFPVISPERWLAEFAALPIKESVRPKILLHNAAKFLGIKLQ
ncbi:MAG: amidohydrolase [Betaproteobacteria bacterium]|nr:amidohydrolase [Betaproteobacteria bacterium]